MHHIYVCVYMYNLQSYTNPSNLIVLSLVILISFVFTENIFCHFFIVFELYDTEKALPI